METVTDLADLDPPRRPVRSFVLREGRLTAGQQRAFATLWPHFGVDWAPGTPLDPAALFDVRRPVVLEIGFGNGESLAAQAAAEPDRGFLGLEVHRPGVGHLLLEIERLGLTNLRVLRADATALLRRPPGTQAGLPDGSLARVQLFFPDPWPKTRHHKRRIVQPDFMRDIARVLAPSGLFHAATDWAPYAEHMRAVIEALPELFENTAGAGRFAPRPARRPLTKFERRGERLGHAVLDLLYRRR
ncbi:tRNA (guanosine(46)-N7)-methyltransferase TrmB [Thiohalocapsa sp. ML1]|jgi:tRNA (guanine-N7-)-methyltransferase|uniref:tRNA (guanosine(46)-N7)-methyltransferase TrmB n=1 Tax=Thiohalocapsa sp. ML1 TaxID=1431688 RepID=UPI000731F498|nr:tRNA (guanosine(46)-N7)-methyltransferase TrmB [Thiohalocapsa sp. ML1]